jgi:glycosyltransferase involved in cell wall biosynthesis
MEIQISVVIPTYRRPKLLIKCLKALTHQDLDRQLFEIIVVSDGPDELTDERLKTWPQVRYFATPEKRGPAAARNYGWLNAKGRLVAFTDDDCIPAPDWLNAFYDQYKVNTNAAFSVHTIVPISEKPTDYERNVAGLQTADFITANCCCPKKVLAITGGFDEEFTMAWREDSDLEFKLIEAQIPINKIANAVVTHPVRQAQWGISIKEQRKTMYNALLYKKYPDLYRKKIQPFGPIHYYAIIIAAVITLAGLILHTPILTKTGSVLWLCLSALFIVKRLRSTTLTFNHLAEMVFTSLLIPFLSVYWQLYGAVKYRVFFL